MNYKITAILTSRSEGGYTVTCEELPGLVVKSDSVDEALENIKDAFAAMLELYKESGRSLPKGIKSIKENTPAASKSLQLSTSISESEIKRKPSKKRLREIQEVYRSMGLDSETLKYFAPLMPLPQATEQERPIVFIESGISSDSHGDFQNAGLD